MALSRIDITFIAFRVITRWAAPIAYRRIDICATLTLQIKHNISVVLIVGRVFTNTVPPAFHARVPGKIIPRTAIRERTVATTTIQGVPMVVVFLTRRGVLINSKP